MRTSKLRLEHAMMRRMLFLAASVLPLSECINASHALRVCV
jgi:hypothetical protein